MKALQVQGARHVIMPVPNWLVFSAGHVHAVVLVWPSMG
jgi:hypothetical protein